jgi:hypothetical protein
MLDDVLHNQCVQDMEEDRVMVAVAEDQVMVAVEDRVMVADIVETDLQETNTKEKEVHVHHMEDKTATPKRSGNLTLKDKE